MEPTAEFGGSFSLQEENNHGLCGLEPRPRVRARAGPG